MDILILTSVYPQKDDEVNIGVTPVVKYFAEEWAKLGHNIVVIHNSNKYPKVVYLLPDSWMKKINSKLGIVIPKKSQRKKLFTKENGIASYRLPMLKVFPKKGYSKLQLKKQFNKILTILNSENFSPDVIVGHWENPQIPLLSMLKKRFNVKTALILHGIVYIKQRRYNRLSKRYIKNIDVFGGRSLAIANKAKELLSLQKQPFICYSGIPDSYFNDKKYEKGKFQNKKPNSYIYVGRIIKRKNIDVVISALKLMYGNMLFELNIVGEGEEKDHLISLIQELNLNNSISLLGYKSRDEVIQLMDDTEVFIMISDNETFGLVYLEAMSRGCIVVASRGGGMEGIIKHSFNGFLCEAGNKFELESICKKVNKMSIEEKEEISNNAIKTANNFRDSQVAQYYLDNVLN